MIWDIPKDRKERAADRRFFKALAVLNEEAERFIAACKEVRESLAALQKAKRRTRTRGEGR